MSDEIILEGKGRVGSVTLNRPKALNALTQPMVLELDARLREWAVDDSLAAIIVRGAARDDGRVPFCAGGDIRLIYGEQNDPERSFATVFYAQEYRLNTFIFRYPKPYVAMIDGVVMGGGVGVSIHGSHRVMTERALFAMPETGIGLFPDVGATYFLPRLKGKAGLYLGLTGARIGAADALDLGLATHVVASDALQALDETLQAADLGGDAHAAIDRLLADCATDPGPAPLAAHRAEIDRCFTAGSVEEIVANLEDRGLGLGGGDAGCARPEVADQPQGHPQAAHGVWRARLRGGDGAGIPARHALQSWRRFLRGHPRPAHRQGPPAGLASGAAGRGDGAGGGCLFRGAAQGRHDVVSGGARHR